MGKWLLLLCVACGGAQGPEPLRECEPIPAWADDIHEAYGCGFEWTDDNCPICLVYFEQLGDALPVPGGACTQVPYCAEILDSGGL